MQIVAVSDEIHLVAMHEFGALEELPEHEHDQHDGQLDVVGHEVDAAERRAEARPALHEHQDTVEADRQDRADRVRPVFEGEEVLEALGFDAGPEAQ